MAKTEHTGFEGQMKDALEHFEVPYNPAHWNELSGKMDAAPSSAKSARKGWFIAAGAALLLSAGSYWMLSEDPSSIAENPVVTETKVQTKAPALEVEEADLLPSSTQQSTDTDVLVDEQPAEIAEETELTSSKAQPKSSTLAPNHVHASAPIETVSSQEAPAELPTSLPTNDPLPSKEDTPAPTTPTSPEPIAVISIQASQTKVCPNNPVEFEVRGEVTNLNYHWDFGDGQVSNQPRPVHNYKDPGNYIVTLTITDSDGQEHTSSEVISMQVLKAPRVDISTESPYDLSVDPYTQLSAVSDEEVQYQWDFGSAQSNLAKQPTTYMGSESVEYLFNTKGNHPVQVMAVNAEGCQTIVSKTVAVNSDYNLLAPTSLAPTGINSTWFPYALQGGRFPFQLKIYDRNGQEVYSTTEFQPWDGTIAGSSQRAKKFESYVWIATTTLKNGKELQFKGEIHIVTQ